MPWEFNYCKALLIFEEGNRLPAELNFRNLIWYDITKKNGSKSEKILTNPRSLQTTTCVTSLVLLHDYVVARRISWSVVVGASRCVLMMTMRSTGP
jgi:hypothetical protein